MPTFRKGHEAIEEAAKGSGGDFKPFIPQLLWKKDKEEKFILVLSPIEDTYTVDLHEFIEVGEGKKSNGDTFTKYEMFVDRTDRGIGESTDKISELGRDSRRRTLGVAIELEPTFETVRNRKRVAGLSVKTDTFVRKSDDGETEIEAPRIGMLIQSQKNFFGWLVSYDRTTNPAHEVPMQVVRRRTDSDTTYDFIPLPESEVDFSGLFDNLEGIGYLDDEDREQIEAEIEAAENDFDAAVAVGVGILEKRFAELIDPDRYEEFIGPLEELPPSRFGSNNKKKDAPKASRTSRPARKSPRSNGNGDGDADESSGDDSGDDDRLARFNELRASVEG